jgi:large subunit ribosomal protein L13
VKSYMATAQTVEKEWFVVDAQGLPLGRLASRIASVLRGKHKPTYTPHADAGDFVIVVNADKVRLTGRKLDQKMYYWYSGYPGGLRARTARQLLARKPEEVLMRAVKGMLPKNILGRDMLRKLKVYARAEHPHRAQQPRSLEV